MLTAQPIPTFKAGLSVSFSEAPSSGLADKPSQTASLYTFDNAGLLTIGSTEPQK